MEGAPPGRGGGGAPAADHGLGVRRLFEQEYYVELGVGRASVVVPSAPSPNLLRRLDDEAELAPFVIDGEAVALHGAGETALRAEGEPLERHDARRLIDAALQFVLRLERGLSWW